MYTLCGKVRWQVHFLTEGKAPSTRPTGGSYTCNSDVVLASSEAQWWSFSLTVLVSVWRASTSSRESSSCGCMYVCMSVCVSACACVCACMCVCVHVN